MFLASLLIFFQLPFYRKNYWLTTKGEGQDKGDVRLPPYNWSALTLQTTLSFPHLDHKLLISPSLTIRPDHASKRAII